MTLSSVNLDVSRMKMASIVSVQMDIDVPQAAIVVKVMNRTYVDDTHCKSNQ